MRRGSAVSLGIAVACATAATFLVRELVNGASGGQAEASTIVVASRAVPFGAPLSADNLREVAWPASQPLAGSFTSIAEVNRIGRRLALAPLQTNEPVLASKVTGPDRRANLSTQIEDGMRAVSVRVDEVRGVAGFVLPGDHVDVVLTRGDPGTQEGSAYADVLLQNIKVLAVDQLATEGQDKPSVARAVTLEATALQAQRVILAQGIGHLSLILRQAGEADLAATRRVTIADLGERGAPPAPGGDDYQAKLDEMRRSVEEKSAQRISDLENRLKNEMSQSAVRIVAPPPAPLPPAPAIVPNPVVTVIRNGNKREPYTVAAER